MTSPRVLMFIPQFLPLVGGAERQVALLSAALASQGMAVEVLTLQLDRRWPLFESVGGIPVHRVPYANPDRWFPGLRGGALSAPFMALNSFRVTAALRRLARSFDVLHAHMPASPVVAFVVAAARRLGLQTIVTPVSTGDLFDLTVLGRHALLGTPSQGWLRKSADCWAAISGAVAEELRGFGISPDRIVNLPNGVSVAEPPVRLPPLARRFLYLGRMSSTARRDTTGLIEAFEAVAAREPEAELALVGGGDVFQQVADRVASSPHARRIHLPGEQDGTSWRAWAHALVQPSFVEGMSNSLLEGMAAGLACVAYDIPPNREVLADGRAGILVPPKDRERLRDVLCDLASMEGMAQELGRRARARSEEHYDIRVVARRATDIYRWLIPSPKAEHGPRSDS